MPFRFLPALLSVILIAGTRASEEASDWFSRAWQTEHGLPDNSVVGVAQVPEGFLWVATKGGVMRFNGTEFSPLALNNIPDLPSRAVRSMFLDRFGRLWLAMERGPIIRLSEDSTRAFTQQDGISSRTVTSMTDDSVGHLWIAYTTGVSKINVGEVTNHDDVPGGDNPHLTSDSAGQVWFACGGKLGRLSDDGFELVRDFGNASLRIGPARDSGLWLTADRELMRLTDGDRFQSITTLPEMTNASVIFEDRDGATWIGSHGLGLLRYQDGSLQSVETSFSWVDCISQDRDGNLWVGTIGGGLNLIKPRTVDHIEETDGIPFTSVQSVTCDSSGRIWVVSQAGHLAYREAGQWQSASSKMGNELANCVAADSRGRILIGTQSAKVIQLENGKLTTYDSSDGLAGISVRSILPATNGDAFIATDNPDRIWRLRDGRISKIHHEGEISAIRAIAEGPNGTIWFGSSKGRLLRLVGDKLVDEKAVEAMPSIRTLHATNDGSLWIGYAGEGLGQLKNNVYTRFTTQDGLFDNYISQIIDDGLGSLWMAANRGLFSVSLDELLADRSPASNKIACRVFGQNDGLPSFQASHNHTPDSCIDQNGRLYFSAANGLLEANPKTLHDRTLAPPVVLEKVTVDGEVKAIHRARSILRSDQDEALTDLSKPEPLITLPPGHDRLVISFAVLSLGSSENVTIRYRLSPMDKKWEQPSNRNSTTFTRLPAGKFKFQVIARNDEGVWNDVGASLDIVVKPFFWETWWFKIGGAALTVLATGGFVFLNLKQKHRHQLQRLTAKRALEQERSRIARDIHDDLGASLTRISLLSQNPPTAECAPVFEQIQNTARHLMRSMNEVVWAINPEHDTFDDLANYLSSYAQDFLSVAGIRCRLELPMDLPEQTLSSQLRHNLFLAFKEALNNAVKHAKASEVRISIETSDDALTLRVSDNGGGIDTSATAEPGRPTAGNGLVNMKSRMEEIGGTCVVNSCADDGTSIEFHVPFSSSS